MDGTGENRGSAEALIGCTGFVGGNLKVQHAFSDLYHSANIEQIRDRAFNLIVSAGTPSVKFRANKEPEADLAAIRRLTDSLTEVKTDFFVLISTLNVYPDPRGVDEDAQIDVQGLSPYGLHRYQLEQFVTEHFPNHLIVRLPGIFGSGLKKNVLFDLMQGNDEFLKQMHVDSVVQFYDLQYLWRDIQRARSHGISLLNAAPESLKLQHIVREVFGREFPGRTEGSVYHDDMHTRYGSLWGQDIPYLYSSAQVMRDLKAFVASRA